MPLLRFSFPAILILSQAITLNLPRAAAQTAEETKIVKRVIPVRHVNPDVVRNSLSKWVHEMIASKELGVITVIGQAKDVEEVEAAIRSLDVPSADSRDANVELTVHFLGVTGEEHTAKLPSGLDAVVAQLRPRFPYSGYLLLDTLLARIRVGSVAEASGVEPDPDDLDGRRSSRPMIYRFRTNLVGVSGPAGAKTVHLQNLRAGFRTPVLIGDNDKYNYADLGVNTDIDVPEGKLVVVGKTGMQGKARGMFVVLQARVDD